MVRKSWIMWITCVLVSMVWGCDSEDGLPLDPSAQHSRPSGQTQAVVVDGLELRVPVEWAPAFGSDVRKAEFTVPGPGGDVSLVIYRLAGGADSAALNIEHWKALVEPAVGAQPRVLELEHDGVHVTAVDLRGRFIGQTLPGVPSQPPIEQARMLAAAVMGSGAPFYFKLVGPAATVDMWTGAWHELLAMLTPA